ncbi:mCG147745 [Mus musculus]|jgi:hypothetical protein|nr:mCG147745 [Mus musculus]
MKASSRTEKAGVLRNPVFKKEEKEKPKQQQRQANKKKWKATQLCACS